MEGEEVRPSHGGHKDSALGVHPAAAVGRTEVVGQVSGRDELLAPGKQDSRSLSAGKCVEHSIPDRVEVDVELEDLPVDVPPGGVRLRRKPAGFLTEPLHVFPQRPPLRLSSNNSIYTRCFIFWEYLFFSL